MSVKSVFLAAAFVFIACGAAFAQTETKRKSASGSVRGETYSYKYSDQDFADTPSWKPEESEPPISAQRAAQIARTNLSRFVSGAENFRVRRILLNGLNDDKWYYNISFVCAGAACRELPTRQFSILVKMDGTILEPKRIVLVD